MAATLTSAFQPLSPIESTLRIQELAQTLEALRTEMNSLRTSGKISPRWWHDSAGRFENDPVFDEIVRLGRQTRARPRTGSKVKRANS